MHVLNCTSYYLAHYIHACHGFSNLSNVPVAELSYYLLFIPIYLIFQNKIMLYNFKFSEKNIYPCQPFITPFGDLFLKLNIILLRRRRPEINMVDDFVDIYQKVHEISK